MPVPSSGPLGLRSDIALEVDGTATGTNVSLRALSNTAGFVTPDAMSEFRGYSSDTIRLVHVASVGGGGAGPTYNGSSLWNETTPNNEGTGCNDDVNLSANITNVANIDVYNQNIYYEILDSDDTLYTGAFNVYYYYNVSANTDIRIRVMAAYISSTTGFLTTTQVQTIRNYDQTGSGTGVFSVQGAVSGSARTLILFSFNSEDSSNNINFTITDINTRVSCPV